MLAITHDFKAPLGSIMGYADLLSRLTVDERQRFYLDNMKTSSEHLLKLVVDLLDFHRLDLNKAEINRVTFHPSRLLEEIHVSFEPLTAAKGLALHCDIAPELGGTYICDPLRLRQIINNLLSNAVKFTDQGSVTMTARYEDRRLVVAIADTGKGMEPADRERIFQEFTRLPGAQGKEGFGLGLSIVRMLVQLLEGTIDVDSVPGKGSTFTIYIPIYPVRSEGRRMKDEESGCAATPNGNSSFPVPHSSLKNVLLIDDDRIQLTLTAAMLQQSGINSVSCLQLDELLDALRTATFDVLLTDVQMPAINGFDLLKLLRASNIPQAQSVPVIAVTARSDMQREEFTVHGFAGCLHKPFTVSELLHELNMEDKGMEVMEVSETSACPGYKFSSLTAFRSMTPRRQSPFWKVLWLKPASMRSVCRRLWRMRMWTRWLLSPTNDSPLYFNWSSGTGCIAETVGNFSWSAFYRRVERTRPCRPRFDRGCHYSGNSFSVMGEQRRIRDFLCREPNVERNCLLCRTFKYDERLTFR